MGLNFSEQSATTVARSITALANIASKFDSETRIYLDSTQHKDKSNSEDIKLVANSVRRNNLLCENPGRKHSKFQKISANSSNNLDWRKIKAWIINKRKLHSKHMQTQENEEDSDTDTDTELDMNDSA